MLAETPLALRYILPDDVYLLRSEKDVLASAAPIRPEAEKPVTEPVIADLPIADPIIQPQTQPAVQQPVAAPAPIAGPVKIPQLTAAPVAPQTPAPQPVATPIATQTPPVQFKYRGGYKKRLLILVYYVQFDLMEDTHLQALGATLNRLDLRSEDVAIMNLHRNPEATFSTIITQLKPAKLVILGDEALPTGLEAPGLNQITALGETAVLYSHSFGAMMGNKDYTRAFWEQIKAI